MVADTVLSTCIHCRVDAGPEMQKEIVNLHAKASTPDMFRKFSVIALETEPLPSSDLHEQMQLYRQQSQLKSNLSSGQPSTEHPSSTQASSTVPSNLLGSWPKIETNVETTSSLATASKVEPNTSLSSEKGSASTGPGQGNTEPTVSFLSKRSSVRVLPRRSTLQPCLHKPLPKPERELKIIQREMPQAKASHAPITVAAHDDDATDDGDDDEELVVVRIPSRRVSCLGTGDA